MAKKAIALLVCIVMFFSLFAIYESHERERSSEEAPAPKGVRIESFLEARVLVHHALPSTSYLLERGCLPIDAAYEVCRLTLCELSDPSVERRELCGGYFLVHNHTLLPPALKRYLEQLGGYEVWLHEATLQELNLPVVVYAKRRLEGVVLNLTVLRLSDRRFVAFAS